MSGPAYIDSFRLIRILPDDVTIAADAVDDTLTLVAGPGISLVANTNADQLTIVNTNPAEFSFGVAGDDSSIKTISSGETVRFAGTQNVTVTADSEGAITITGPNLSNQSNWDTAYSWGNHALAGYLTSTEPIGDDITVGSVRINTNVITTVDSNANLELHARGTGFDAQPRIILIRPDDKIVIGGSFTDFDGWEQNRIVRLNSDGSRDET